MFIRCLRIALLVLLLHVLWAAISICRQHIGGDTFKEFAWNTVGLMYAGTVFWWLSCIVITDSILTVRTMLADRAQAAHEKANRPPDRFF